MSLSNARADAGFCKRVGFKLGKFGQNLGILGENVGFCGVWYLKGGGYWLPHEGKNTLKKGHHF